MPVATTDMTMDEPELDCSSPEVMKLFYSRLFPWKTLFSWLNHDHVPTRQWTHREFAFTLQGDIYLRYNSFNNADEMKKEVIRLNPSRFEIGAVYSARPRDKKTLRPNALQPQRRELVFDIDMTDYDEIRTCCSDKAMCKRCWGYIAAATDVLDSALRDHFGYQHLLWVYSGRRGIHCWVSDSAALDLTDDQRRAVISFLEVVKGGKEQNKKVNVRWPKSAELHPNLKEAHGILTQHWVDLILNDQECFKSKEQYEALLALFPDPKIVATLRSKWSAGDGRSSLDRWNDLSAEVKKTSPGIQMATNKAALEDIVLQYTYPRLDAEVSKHRNHLLKSPFCVHPGTNRVCVPIDPSKVHSFDPSSVPTVGRLLNEFNAASAAKRLAAASSSSLDGDEGEDRKPNLAKAGVDEIDWKETSLRPYVEMLERHVAGLMKATREKKRSAGQMSMEF